MLKQLTIVLGLVLAGMAEETFREKQLERQDCDAGWDKANGKCYYLSTFETDYFSALYWCKFHQGRLLEIDEEYEHYLVRRISRFRNGHARYWIGVTDTFEEGKWLTATGLVPPSKMYWKPRQPDDWKRSEDCVEVDSFSLQWNDLACSTRLKFICEKKKEEKRSPSIS